RGVNGEYHPVLGCGVPVRDDDGRVLCWAGINLDISRLKEAEAELQLQAEELNQFAEYIHKGVARMERLIRDLLHYSRVIHEQSESHAVDAGAAAQEAVKVSQALVEQSGAQVTIDAL